MIITIIIIIIIVISIIIISCFIIIQADVLLHVDRRTRKLILIGGALGRSIRRTSRLGVWVQSHWIRQILPIGTSLTAETEPSNSDESKTRHDNCSSSSAGLPAGVFSFASRRGHDTHVPSISEDLLFHRISLYFEGSHSLSYCLVRWVQVLILIGGALISAGALVGPLAEVFDTYLSARFLRVFCGDSRRLPFLIVKWATGIAEIRRDDGICGKTKALKEHMTKCMGSCGPSVKTCACNLLRNQFPRLSSDNAYGVWQNVWPVLHFSNGAHEHWDRPQLVERERERETNTSHDFRGEIIGSHVEI